MKGLVAIVDNDWRCFGNKTASVLNDEIKDFLYPLLTESIVISDEQMSRILPVVGTHNGKDIHGIFGSLTLIRTEKTDPEHCLYQFFNNKYYTETAYVNCQNYEKLALMANLDSLRSPIIYSSLNTIYYYIKDCTVPVYILYGSKLSDEIHMMCDTAYIIKLDCIAHDTDNSSMIKNISESWDLLTKSDIVECNNGIKSELYIFTKNDKEKDDDEEN